MRWHRFSRRRVHRLSNELKLVENVTNPEMAEAGVPRVGISLEFDLPTTGCRTVRIGSVVTEDAGLELFIFSLYDFFGFYGKPPEAPFSTRLSSSRPGGTGHRLCCLDLYPMRFRACRVQA